MRIPIKRKSQLIYILILGFGFLIILLSFFAYTSVKNANDSYQKIHGSRQASDKIEIIVELIEIARTRTRLTLKMIYEEDAFIKDEIGLKLDIYASRFIQKKKQLINLGLSPEEKRILDKQGKTITPIQALQRKAAEMALSDDIKVVTEARKILLDEVYTGQGVIIDYFMELLNHQKNIIDNSHTEATTQYTNAKQLELTLFTVILCSALLVSYFVIRRIISIEKELFLEKEKAQITLRSIGDAVITTNRLGLVDYLNPVAEKITGYITRDVKGKSIGEVFKAYDETNQSWIVSTIMELLDKGNYKIPSTDIILYDSSDTSKNIALNIAPIQSETHTVLGSITTFQDITKEKVMAKHIEHQARHDALTGLLNRREFEIKVEQSLKLYSEGTSHALCVMDLDRFKIVNDTMGHAAGDELLRQISKRIKSVLRKTDLFARIGGDEFALFLSNVGTSEASKISEKILNTVREYQFLWGDKAFRIGASIGLVDAPAQTSNYENLYHAADTACYMAKHEGRDRTHVVSYDDANVTEKREQTQWVSKINEALEDDRFTLYAQEIVPLTDNPELLPHKEVLIRMLSEEGDVIPPMAFIPPAERYNLMPKLDNWVIKNVIRQVKSDDTNTVYAVNLSGQSMADNKFTTEVLEIIDQSNINNERLCFEITETAAISNLENAREFLNNLQELGCYTALDDFGSGLSSFAYLRTMPINYLKIDGMFVRQIVEDRTSYVMVEAIHAIGRTMGLKTIAEFVENEDIKNELIKMGIDYAQGYHFGAPTPMI